MKQIRLENVSFCYEQSEEYTLKDISMIIEPSSFNIICGGTGSGKSTLVRQMKKEILPYGRLKGNVLYGDCLISELDNRVSACEIGYVSQNIDNQLVMDKVWHELAFGLENIGMQHSAIRRRVAEIAGYFGISEWLDKDVENLSGGQKQRLSLASIMIMQPKVLILDEPVSQLDPIAATEFMDMVVKINRDIGTTIVMVEHRLEEVFGLADMVWMLENGMIVAKGSPNEVSRKLYEDKSDMIQMLPAATRLYIKTDKNINHISDTRFPLTVREGRLWYEQLDREPLQKDVFTKNSDSTIKREVLVSMKNVWYNYDTYRYAVKNVQLDIYKNEVVCIVGGNGAGKSTLALLMAGVKKCKKGKVTCDGQVKRGIVIQNPQALFTEISVQDELYVMTRAIETDTVLSNDKKTSMCNELLAMMELDNVRLFNPLDISGGQMQKLAMAKAMMLKPDLLILDEPTKGLDACTKDKLGNIIKDYENKNSSVCIVTHDLEFAAKYANRCVFMSEGEIISDGDVASVLGQNMYYTTTLSRVTSGKLLTI